MKATCLVDSTPRGPKVAANEVRCQECTVSLEVVFQGPTNTKVVSITVDYKTKLGSESLLVPNALAGGCGEIKQANTSFLWPGFHSTGR